MAARNERLARESIEITANQAREELRKQRESTAQTWALHAEFLAKIKADREAYEAKDMCSSWPQRLQELVD